MAKMPSRRSAFRVSEGRKQGKAGAPRKLKTKLAAGQRRELKELLRRGNQPMRVIKRAQIL